MHIINTCLLNHTFPTVLKNSDICPIPKSGKISIGNLRPISLVSIPSKTIEHFVLKSVKSIIIDKVDRSQFGYIPYSSTTCALISIHDFITNCLDDINIQSVLLITFDFSKAFDSVSHNGIIDCLYSMDFPIDFIEFTKHYLCNRSQRVVLNGFKSDYLSITCGVPQGSVLGPFYFLLYIASLLPIHNSTHCVKYADDSTFMCPIFKNDIHASISVVKSEIDNVISWSTRHKLSLNLSKTNIIVFNKHMYNATPIDYCTYLPDIRIVDSLKILGVIFSSNLSWSQHFNSVISRVAKRLHLLRVLRPLISHSDLHKIFNSSICSVIEYAAPLFCIPSSVICNTLDSFYKRCTKIMQCKRVSCNISHVSTCTRFTN